MKKKIKDGFHEKKEEGKQTRSKDGCLRTGTMKDQYARRHV